MSEIASFSIQNPKEITRHLVLLLKKKCFIDAHFGDSKDSYITTLLAINETDNTLVLDCSPKEEINQRMLTSSKITFDTEYTGIKVSFAGAKLKKILHKGDPAFVMPVPKSLYWMQRREYYRVKSPLSKPSYCQLILEDRAPVDLTLYDISLTGFSMLNVSKELSDLLIPGTSILSSNLLLSGIGDSPILFEICNKYVINPEKIQKIQKIGCKFIRLSRPAEEFVQRYMQQVQRDNLQKE